MQNDNWNKYRSWMDESKANSIISLERAQINYEKSKKYHLEYKLMYDKNIIRQFDVVGLTTTCASRIRELLREISPPIVIFEEAALIMEAGIISTLTEYCQHVILLGDSKQLAPNVNNYELDKEKQLSLSFFERMGRMHNECLLNV